MLHVVHVCVLITLVNKYQILYPVCGLPGDYPAGITSQSLILNVTIRRAKAITGVCEMSGKGPEI